MAMESKHLAVTAYPLGIDLGEKPYVAILIGYQFLVLFRQLPVRNIPSTDSHLAPMIRGCQEYHVILLRTLIGSRGTPWIGVSWIVFRSFITSFVLDM